MLPNVKESHGTDTDLKNVENTTIAALTGRRRMAQLITEVFLFFLRIVQKTILFTFN
jgi:hypothetical protein